MIPSNLYTFWFGPNPIPDREKIFIENTKRNVHDMQVHIITSENMSDWVVDLPEVHDFIEHVYRTRKWAFLADLFKVLVLFKAGGWVMDADNEFKRSPSFFSALNWVSSWENWRGRLSPITAVMGAVPNHQFTKILLSNYVRNSPDVLCSIPNTMWISRLLYGAGMNKKGDKQRILEFDVDILPHEVFCGDLNDPKCFAAHHFHASWK